MHPPSFFAPYTPPGGNPYSYHLHSAIRLPAQAPAQAPPSNEATPYRPGKPYFPPSPTPSDQPDDREQAPGPVPHPGPSRPKWPPPFSPPEEALVPAYSASSPPPIYSPQGFDDSDKCRCDLCGEDGYDDGDDEPNGRVRTLMMWILIGLNILVWGSVFYYWIQDDLMGRLWAEVQAEGGIRFQF